MLNSTAGSQNGAGVAPSLQAPIVGPSIRTATGADEQRCLEVLTLAFENDPPSRWIWPDRQQYRDAFPRFAKAFGGGAIDFETAQYTQGFSGVAFWLPPGCSPDEDALVEVIRETVSPGQRDAAFAMFEQMDIYHPRQPHWHLPLIGVDPTRQGQGIGASLLRRVLDHCDRVQLPAYLEATSPRNVALYRRHGFQMIGSIQVADSPPVVPMLREPF